MKFFPDPEPPTINILYGWSEMSGQFGSCSFVSSFTTSSKLIIFCIVLLDCYIKSFLYHLLNLCLFHVHMFLSTDCILLSLVELKAILWISSVKILCLSLWNLCCIFNIALLFVNSLWFSLILSASILLFFGQFKLFSIWVASKQFL